MDGNPYESPAVVEPQTPLAKPPPKIDPRTQVYVQVGGIVGLVIALGAMTALGLGGVGYGALFGAVGGAVGTLIGRGVAAITVKK